MTEPAHGEIIRPSLARRLRHCAVLALLLAVSGCKADLYTKMQEREANEMLALLLNNGVDAVRVAAKDGTSSIQVEEKQLAFSIDILNAQGLPRQPFKSLGDIFERSGLIASPTEERARYVYALNEELSRTISDIDGVLSVRVHVVLPNNGLMRQDATPSSASVFIRHDSDANLSILLPQIKLLVANSIEGLSYDKVEVVLVPVERLAFKQRPAPMTVLNRISQFIPSPFLAILAGVAAAVFVTLFYFSARALMRRGSHSLRRNLSSSSVSAIAAGRKTSADYAHR
ncbi:type III secretion system inner membrane ring lipoprotein SctJ [Rhizobium grahamii]|uniref:Lipoprotein n=1 Tax=Rhizobium grahamii TaxID=1120045 RepID=A0A370KH75_9HYPH|nr:type III secretion inner membrane ring lipoprotein SctJ [Rhizobium grahamii]RDJ04495.1 EscJ/YscJ/HrcJ family type III secretion inner membrane ring protein [Rhizobium grahamii]